jgi:hypothetical protein
MAPKWFVFQLLTIFMLTGALAAERNPADDWRTYINDACIVSDEPFLLPETDDQSSARMAPLFGIIASKLANTLVSSIVSGFSGGARAAAARKDTKLVTTNDFNLYLADLSDSAAATINPRLGCITVVAGEFQADGTRCSIDYNPRTISAETVRLPQSDWQTDRADNSVENILRRANVCVAGQVKSIFEARIEFSDDGTAYRMNNAGFWINSLHSTKSSRAKRNLLYTLEIAEPSEGGGGRVLSTAWVNIGQVTAGDTASDVDSIERSDWLQVPPMSRSAHQAYQADTAAHQDVIGEIEALERAVVRDARMLSGIEKRAESADAEVRIGLDKEMAKIRVGIVTKESMLDARRAEYEDLPQPTLLYMPVTVRFGITESRSERLAMQVLAATLEDNKTELAATATNMVGIDRSLDLDESATDIEALRQEYFDALIAFETASGEAGDALPELERRLTVTKTSYNAARIAEGLDPVD